MKDMTSRALGDFSGYPSRPGFGSILAGIPLAFLTLLLMLGSRAPAGAVEIGCGNAPGYDIRFSHFFEEIPSIPADRCSDTFKCAKPESSGGSVQKIDSGCDAEAGPCAVRVVFPLQFRGNRENVDDVGLSGAPTPVVYWFDGPANESCQPWLSTSCGQVGICGQTFAKIPYDVIDTYLNLGTASCANPTPTAHSGVFSILAASCPSRFSCPKREFDSLNVSPAEVKKGLSCVEPPKEECNGDSSCTSCLAGGVGAGGGPPGMGGPGAPQTGPGATLRYAGGGAGFTGLPGSTAHSLTLGRGWSHDYAERIVPFPDESRVFLITRFGTYREWGSPDAGGVYQAVSPSSEHRTLTHLGTGLGWTLTELDGTVHEFDASGLWVSTTDRNGNQKIAIYTGGELTSVSFPDQRREDFTYHLDGKLASITEVGTDNSTSRTWSYTWSGDDIIRIDRPDGTALLFTYGDVAHPGFLTRMELLGEDGTSTRVLRAYGYDVEGNVVKTWRGDTSSTGANAVDLWSLSFDNPTLPTQTTVTDPLGDVSTYQLARDTASTNIKVTSISGSCPVCDLGPNVQIFYEDAVHPLLPTRIVNGRGFTTVMSYDAFGQMLSKTEAMGEAEERTTTWTYNATYPALPESLERPSTSGGAALRMTDWTYDASGNPTGEAISGVEGGSAFSYAMTTTFNAQGQPLSSDPPGFGTTDQTTFAYDPARGSLIADSRTDPLVGTTTFGNDSFNRVTSVTDPNGVATATSYDGLDRVTELRQVGDTPGVNDLVTTNSYTTFGDLFRTQLPAGNIIEYGYDPVGRLTSIERKPDASTNGERVLYTLDAAGNRILEEKQLWDSGASAWTTLGSTAFDFSTRCHVDRIVRAPGSPEEAVTEFDYDCNGNLVARWDANYDASVDPPTTSYTYDGLDRIASFSEPWSSGGERTTIYGYSVQDHVVSITDAEGNTTTYTYSDRDLLTQENSAVSGITTHSYNDHGALVSSTDARGVTVARTVDELDRLTFADYPDDTLDTSYAYDSQPVVCGGTSFPVGRIGTITRNGESVEYCYDRFGRPTRDGDLTFGYDANGNRTTVAYPAGVTATYGFDFADREASLSVTSPEGTEPVVSGSSYLPNGPLSTLLLGSGVTESRAFDGRYVPTGITLSGPTERTWSFTTDRVGNILEIVEFAGCTAGPIVLETQTVTTEESFVSCSTIEAGNDFRIESPGDVAFHAQGTIALKSGFSVGSGARFVAGSGGLPALSHRTYSYQAPQYFLTSALGPWGDLSWSYDKIGNRLSEDRNGSTDTYVYLSNGAGNTPVLDQVMLGVGGIRDYTYGPAGHLEEVAAGGNMIDFGNDAEGRLAGTVRTVASESASFLYDGRSFLREAQATAGGTSSVDPVYDSSGLVHALRRRASPTDPEEIIVFLYLADRPVAQLEIDGAGVETWSYIIIDHLGTPLLATDDNGLLTWEGGFEPFGRDYQAGTPAGALESGIYLRLPGQWQEETWSNATSGAGIYYNVHRWLEMATGRYNRPDPLGLQAGINLYLYAEANPIINRDLKGLSIYVCSRPAWGLHGVANHSYLWDPRPGTPPDDRYCGVFSDAQESGPSVDACNYVPGSDGKEDTIMQCCQFIKKRSSAAFYMPFANDCQTGTSRALNCAGVEHPGVPGGRLGLPCDSCSIAPPPPPPRLVPKINCPPGTMSRTRGIGDIECI